MIKLSDKWELREAWEGVYLLWHTKCSLGDKALGWAIGDVMLGWGRFVQCQSCYSPAPKEVTKKALFIQRSI